LGLLLLLRLPLGRGSSGPRGGSGLRCASASAATLAATRGLLLARLGRLLLLRVARRTRPLLLVARRTRSLLLIARRTRSLLLIARGTGPLLPRRTLLLALLLPLLLLLAGTRPVAPSRLLLLRTLPFGAFLPRALLELAHFFLEEAQGLAVLLQAQFVVPAVGAALPSFGVGLLAGVAENAFRERHREIGAHCTLRPVDESRRRTLQALIHLAEENSPSACWDDRRAMELLRREATREELRELGVEERMIEHIFTEEHA
jgi:hypothetical protein